MPTKVIAIDLIQVLGSVQPRQTLNEDAIADYAEHYKPESNGKAPLPPLRVFWDGKRHILSRGFHRYTAAQRAKRGSLECEILNGDERAAILDAMQDNSDHGVRLTPDDKRKAVNRLLDDPEWGKLQQYKIAEMANVSLSLVRDMVAERNRKDTSTEGKVLELSTNNKGKKRRKSKPGVKGGIKAIKPKPNPWDNIAPNITEQVKAIKPGDAEIERLAEYTMDQQREIVKLLDDKIKTIGQAMGEFDGPAVPQTPEQERANLIRKQLGGLVKTVDNVRTGIDKVLKALDDKRPSPDFAQEALDLLDKAGQTLVRWQRKVK